MTYDPTQQAPYQAPQQYDPSPPPAPQDLGFEVDLDFGGQEAIHGSIPVPDGIYVLKVTDSGVIPTKDGTGRMVKLTSVVEAKVDGGREDHTFDGRGVIDNWFLPDRVQQTPEAYNSTRGFLRGKLEAVTGKEWGQDGMKLNVRSLPGLRFKALIVLRDEGTGYGPQNRITRYMPLNMDVSGIPIPVGQMKAPAQGRQPANNAAPSPAGAQAAGAAPRFRI